MDLINKIREALGKKESKIKFRGEVSGTDWIEVKMTNFTGKPIALGTPLTDLKIGIQPLTSGIVSFSQRDLRVDNAHGPLHQHSGSSIFPVTGSTMSGALVASLGSAYWVLEKDS